MTGSILRNMGIVSLIILKGLLKAVWYGFKLMIGMLKIFLLLLAMTSRIFLKAGIPN